MANPAAWRLSVTFATLVDARNISEFDIATEFVVSKSLTESWLPMAVDMMCPCTVYNTRYTPGSDSVMEIPVFCQTPLLPLVTDMVKAEPVTSLLVALGTEVHDPSSRRYRDVPAVDPASGTKPTR
jgi:hypothetical protein